MNFDLSVKTHWRVECWRDGLLQWVDEFDNLVVTAGLNKVLDATFKTGLASPAWYIGLVNNASFTGYVAGDILSSHGGWLEFSGYTGNRKAFTPGSISGGSVDNSGATATFAITSGATVRGAFLCDAASGSSGTLYGEGDFSGGSKTVSNGDNLIITATLTATAS